jgi:hypothetical protein
MFRSDVHHLQVCYIVNYCTELNRIRTCAISTIRSWMERVKIIGMFLFRYILYRDVSEALLPIYASSLSFLVVGDPEFKNRAGIVTEGPSPYITIGHDCTQFVIQ